MTRKQLDIHYTTPEIEAIAMRLGASRGTVYQWRYRGVPLAWRIRICTNSRKIKLHHFPDPPDK